MGFKSIFQRCHMFESFFWSSPTFGYQVDKESTGSSAVCVTVLGTEHTLSLHWFNNLQNGTVYPWETQVFACQKFWWWCEKQDKFSQPQLPSILITTSTDKYLYVTKRRKTLVLVIWQNWEEKKKRIRTTKRKKKKSQKKILKRHRLKKRLENKDHKICKIVYTL